MTKVMEANSNNMVPDPVTGKIKTRPQQVPVRAVMNNRTLSIYENAEDYTSHFTTYNLKTSDFRRSTRDKTCFYISEGARRTELCPFGFAKTEKAYTEWDRDFHVFRDFCETKPDEVAIQLKKSLDDKIAAAKQAVLGEREAMVKKKLQRKDQDNNFDIIKTTNAVVQKAINKEQDLESLIEKEEADKESADEQLILDAIENEKKKNVFIYY